MYSQASHHMRERGATALFLVLFASLLLSIITVSFAAMMIREQQRSTDDEQSQSAYDAALSGVEDGKRVIAACNSGAAGACAAIDSRQCTTVSQAGIRTAEPNGEVLVQTAVASDGRRYNQAYTCVKVTTDTPDVIKTIERDESAVIPLKGSGAFTQIVLSWHNVEDAAQSLPAGTPSELPPLGTWPSTRPALLRVQLMQFQDNTITPASFDSGPNAHTVYLYPQTSVSVPSFAMDARRSGGLEPESVYCTTPGFPLTGYACRAVLTLPGSIANRVGYLRLTSLYNATHLKAELQNGAGARVDFRDVQTAVDSTGRTNDLFRRVEARIETADPSFPYPRATVDIMNNFCKTLAVTADPSDYDNGVSVCDPAGRG